MYQHILLPTDGSDAAMRAVRQGAELAARLGARVTVMTALEHFPAGIMASNYRPPDAPQEEPGLQLAQERLAMAEAAVRQAGLTPQRLLVRDLPVFRAILDAAQTSGADLIVMGTHGMGLIERLFIGSQTQRVLAHTSIPVLTLH
jgi:nucleotide-binding universal stress UspA family protein